MIKQTLKVGLLALGLFSTMTIPTAPAQAQNLSENLGTDPKVKTGKLKNGLTYYIRPNQKPENKVELRLVLNAGSLLETDEQLGLAHFTEHMLFNGTKNFPKNKLVDELQSLGVQFGADLNAYTSFDETVYMLPIPTDKPGNLETGFQILQDWAQGALLTDKDIEEERKIILEESRMGKGAQDRMQRQFLPKLFGENSRYSVRLPIGKDELLKTFKPKSLRDFYKDWYRPDLMAVIVVGDVTTEKAEELVKKYFSTLKNPSKPKERTIYGVDGYKGQETMYLTDKEQSNTVLFLNFNPRKSTADKTVGDYRKSIVENLAISAMNQRFGDLSKSATPPFIAAQVDNSSMVRNYKGFGLYVVPSDDLTKSINAAAAEILSVQQFGYNKSEIELVKTSMLSNMEKYYNERNTTNSSNYVGEYQRNFLEGEAYPGIEKEYELYKTLLPGITAEEVTNVFKSMLKAEDLDDYFAVVMSPENKNDKIKDNATLKTAINAAFQQTAVAKEEVVVSENLLDQLPAKGSIVNTTTDAKLGTTTYTLSNGVKVTVKKTDFKSDEIVFSAVKHGGANNYGVEDKANVNLLGTIIETMGYGNYTPTDLEKALTGKNVSLLPNMGSITNSLNGSSDIKSLKTFFELLHLQVTKPRIDEALLNGFISNMKTQLAFIKANPQAAFVDTMIKNMYNNNPLAPMAIPTVEILDQINAAKAVEIYKKEFSSADGYHMYFVGNIDENTLKPLLEQYVASIPTTGTKPSFRDNGLRLKSGNNKFVFEKGADPKSLIVGQYFGEMAYTEDLSTKAALIGDILTIRVIEKMREEMGSIYGGSFSGSFQRDPYPYYNFSVELPTGPENVDGLLAATEKELNNLKQNGPDAKDLDKVKKAILEKRKEQIKTNRYWVSKLQQLTFHNYSVDRFLNFEQELNKITVKDIKDAANKFFDGKNSYIGIKNPEKK